MFPLRGCPVGEDPKETRARELCPPLLSPAGRDREKGRPSLLSKPRPAGKECHVFLFPINCPPPPPQQPSAFLRPGVKTATGESWEGWLEPHWWLAPGLKGSPQEPGEPHPPAQGPPTRPQGLALTPFHNSRLGEKTPHPREGWGRPQRPLGRKSAGRGAEHRPVPLGLTHASPLKKKKNQFLFSGNTQA